MKQSQLNILISSIFLVGSILSQDFISSFLLLIGSVTWGICGLLHMRLESKIETLEIKMGFLKFEILVTLLQEILTVTQNKSKKEGNKK